MQEKDDIFWPLFFLVVLFILSNLIGCSNDIQGPINDSQCLYEKGELRQTVRDTGTCAPYVTQGTDTLLYTGSGWMVAQ